MAACGSESLEVPSADSVSPALPDDCVQRVRIVHGSCVPALLSLVHLHPALGSLHAPVVAPNPVCVSWGLHGDAMFPRLRRCWRLGESNHPYTPLAVPSQALDVVARTRYESLGGQHLIVAATPVLSKSILGIFG